MHGAVPTNTHCRWVYRQVPVRAAEREDHPNMHLIVHLRLAAGEDGANVLSGRLVTGQMPPVTVELAPKVAVIVSSGDIFIWMLFHRKVPAFVSAAHITTFRRQFLSVHTYCFGRRHPKPLAVLLRFGASSS